MFRSTCTICTDALTQDLIACPCGHVYHSNCLTTWFARSKTCPTCRKSCRNSFKLFFSDQDIAEDSNDNITNVKNELQNKLDILKEKELESLELKKEYAALTKEFDKTKKTVQDINMKWKEEILLRDILKKQVAFLNEDVKDKKKIKEELTNYKSKLSACHRIEIMLADSCDEAEEMLKRIGNGSKTQQELASQLIIMKRENEKMRESKRKARLEKDKVERDFNVLLYKFKTQASELANVKKSVEKLQYELKDAEQEKHTITKKLEKLQQSIQSDSPRTSIINRLLQESPAPLGLKVHNPTLTPPTDEVKSTEETLRTTSKAMAVLSEKVFTPVHPGALRLNRKRTYPNIAGKDAGRLRTGYNGLGGHTTILMPPTSTCRLKKKVSKPIKISKFVNTKTSDPPLPHL